MNFDYPEIDFVLGAMAHYNIEVIHTENPHITLQKGYVIEIEGRDLYKLLHHDAVISPFDDINDLCDYLLLLLR